MVPVALKKNILAVLRLPPNELEWYTSVTQISYTVCKADILSWGLVLSPHKRGGARSVEKQLL